MKRNEVLQIRIEPDMQARLQQLRDKRHVNISAWLRDLISAELDREFPPPAAEPPAETRAPTGSWDDPLPGFRTCTLPDHSFGSAYHGDTSKLPNSMRDLWIEVTDRNDATFLTQVTETVSRTDQLLKVRDSGRPAKVNEPGPPSAQTAISPARSS